MDSSATARTIETRLCEAWLWHCRVQDKRYPCGGCKYDRQYQGYALHHAFNSLLAQKAMCCCYSSKLPGLCIDR